MSQTKTIGHYLLAYLLWAVSVALAFVCLLVGRTTVMLALGMTPWDRFVEHAINQFGFLVLAIVGLSMVVFTEHFYRTAVEKSRLWQRFALITAIEVGILALAHLAQWISGTVLSIPVNPLYFMLEAMVGVLFLVLYRRSRQDAKPPH